MSRYLLVRLALPLAVLSLLATAHRASAQDAQYWSIQYGPVGQLVGGQLIGGVSDLSATFYNPGALSLRNESSYLLSTESVQWEQLSVESDPMVQMLDTSSSRFGAAPSLLAGALPRWLGEDTRLAWSFLTRQKLDARLGQRLTDPLGPAYTISAAESYLDQEISENWAGLSFSRPVGQSVGIGGTWYGVYRGQRTRKELTAQGITTGGAAANVSGVSVDRPKMNDPSTCTSAWRNACRRFTSPSPASLKFLKTAFNPSGVTDSTPTSAPRTCARRMAARNSGSSAASIVICV